MAFEIASVQDVLALSRELRCGPQVPATSASMLGMSLLRNLENDLMSHNTSPMVSSGLQNLFMGNDSSLFSAQQFSRDAGLFQSSSAAPQVSHLGLGGLNSLQDYGMSSATRPSLHHSLPSVSDPTINMGPLASQYLDAMYSQSQLNLEQARFQQSLWELQRAEAAHAQLAALAQTTALLARAQSQAHQAKLTELMAQTDAVNQRGRRQSPRNNTARGTRGHNRSNRRQPAGPVVPRAPTWADANWHPMASVLASGQNSKGGTGVFLPPGMELSVGIIGRDSSSDLSSDPELAASETNSEQGSPTQTSLPDDWYY